MYSLRPLALPAPTLPPSIRFPVSRFRRLRNNLLADLAHESFALLLAQCEDCAGQPIIAVRDIRYPHDQAYRQRGRAYLNVARDFFYAALVEVTERLDVNTLIDVHTHPFSTHGVTFSGTDDQDERRFYRFLTERFDGLFYGSIVLSQSDYSARLWGGPAARPHALTAEIRTQTAPEAWPAADRYNADRYNQEERQSEVDPGDDLADPDGRYSRAVLALGQATLARLMHGQPIAVVGAGGLGSVLAENLLQMGFQELHLIDPDRIELANLNRLVGATHADVAVGTRKVTALRRHLMAIHPGARIHAHPQDVREPALLPVLANCRWLIVTTDNQTSRRYTQAVALRYLVPLISVGSNITVADGELTDMSGEVIVIRAGDKLCLHCLGRLNPLKLAAEAHPDEAVRTGLVNRGYVQGLTVTAPAVKTLNAQLAALATDQLVNQFTERQAHRAIWVYENNRGPTLYPDQESLVSRRKDCYSCGSL